MGTSAAAQISTARQAVSPEKVGVFTVDAKAVKALLDHVEGNLKKSR
jgi:hypothetical protein